MPADREMRMPPRFSRRCVSCEFVGAVYSNTSGLYSRMKYWYAVAPYGADIDHRRTS